MFKDFFFSYFYYRLYHINANKGEFQGGPAAVIISLIQMMLLLDVSILVMEIFFSKGYFSAYSKSIAYVGAFMSLMLVIFNYNRYSDKIEVFNEKWIGESPFEKRLKGFAIILLIFLPFLPLLLVTEF